MQVGDTLVRAEVNRIPTGTIVRHQPDRHSTVLIKVDRGFHWSDSDSSHPAFEAEIYVDHLWTVVYVPEPVVPKVGETIRTVAEAAALPVGTMIYDDASDDAAYAVTNGAGERPAVKVGPNRWMWHQAGASNQAVFDRDNLVEAQPHRVVFIPEVAA